MSRVKGWERVWRAMDTVARSRAVARAAHNMEVSEDGCWLWRGTYNAYGRPVMSICHRGRAAQVLVAVLMCTAVRGRRPGPSVHCAHRCHQRACIRPAHLHWQRGSDNVRETRGTPRWWVAFEAADKGKLAVRILRHQVRGQRADCWESTYKSRVNGRPRMRLGPCFVLVAQVLCALTHGLPPHSGYDAAHACHWRACTTSAHLSWQLHGENWSEQQVR